MRYLLLIMAQLGDFFIFATIFYLLYKAPHSLFIWFIVGMAFYTWKKQGGFCAWKPEMIRKFLKNAKEYGL